MVVDEFYAWKMVLVSFHKRKVILESLPVNLSKRLLRNPFRSKSLERFKWFH